MVDTEWLFILTTTVALGVSITDMAFQRVDWTRNFQQESKATDITNRIRSRVYRALLSRCGLSSMVLGGRFKYGMLQ